MRYPEKLPVGEGVREVAELLNLDPVEIAFASGEEFELVFTVKPELADELDFEFSVIGKVTAEGGVYVFERGERRYLPRLGWEHFDRGLFR